MIGLIENRKYITKSTPEEDDVLFVIGNTTEDMGGSEYYEYVHRITGGKVPTVDLKTDSLNSKTVLEGIRKD
jgi:phosphoribosylformylglycinamidine synthase